MRPKQTQEKTNQTYQLIFPNLPLKTLSLFHFRSQLRIPVKLCTAKHWWGGSHSPSWKHFGFGLTFTPFFIFRKSYDFLHLPVERHFFRSISMENISCAKTKLFSPRLCEPGNFWKRHLQETNNFWVTLNRNFILTTHGNTSDRLH